MITPNFLNNIATYVSSRIAKVVLNGTYTITVFEAKTVTDNMVALNYIIPASAVSLVTLIEVKDASDNVISSKPVSLPVTSDTLMLETYEIEEVTG